MITSYIKKASAFALALALLFSCSIAEPEFIEDTESGLVYKTFTVAQDVLTKADIDDSYSVEWQVGDRFSVYDPVAKTGRIFTTTKVEQGMAVIEGSISKGDFTFSAVYPYEALDAWSDDGTPALKAPEHQVIPQGAQADPLALIASVLDANPDSTIAFSPCFPLVKFNVAIDDVNKVVFTLRPSDGEATVIEVEAGAVKLDKGDYFACVPEGNYDGGISVLCSTLLDTEITKTSKKALSIAGTGVMNLGTVTDGKEHIFYELGERGVYHGIVDMLEQVNFMGYVAFNITSEIQLILKAFFLRYGDEDVVTIPYTYMSKGIHGEPLKMSSIIYIPERCISHPNNVSNKLEGISLINHHTITRKSECPSKGSIIEGLTAWRNYAMIIPDYYGFGAAEQYPQAFVNGPFTAMGNIDAFKAARQILDDMGIKYRDQHNNIGYSQGGLVAVANLKYTADHPECGVKFAKTFAGGGPYDFKLCYDEYVKDVMDPYTYSFVYLSIISVIESEGLGLDYTKIFKDPLLSHIQDWVLDKECYLWDVANRVNASALSDIITADIQNEVGPESAAIMDKLESYNLVNGWKVPVGSELYLFHSQEDNFVPYRNFELLREALGESSRIHYENESQSDHLSAALDFIQIVLRKI